jgi:hypothetical protein
MSIARSFLYGTWLTLCALALGGCVATVPVQPEPQSKPQRPLSTGFPQSAGAHSNPAPVVAEPPQASSRWFI